MRIRPASRRLGGSASSDDEHWESRAACTPKDADLLTAEDDATLEMAARTICHGRQCPVMRECSETASDRGVWGGLVWSGRQAQAQRKQRAS